MLGPDTEPSFTAIGPAYNRMLAIALLLAGAFISAAVAERVLGGPKGAGWNVIPRTVAACMAAFAGLGVVEYLAHYASLMATAMERLQPRLGPSGSWYPTALRRAQLQRAGLRQAPSPGYCSWRSSPCC